MMLVLPYDISTETLKHFFSISKKRIGRDRTEGMDGFVEGWEKVKRYLGLSKEEKATPLVCAEFLHDLMILACSAHFDQRLPECIAIQFASCAAYPIGDAIIMIQTESGSGQLRAFEVEIETMEKNAGVEDREDPGEWPIEETRGEFESLMHRCGELIGKVKTTVILEVLRRYKLDSMAELFERNEEEFDRKSQEGSHLLFPEAHAIIRDTVRKDLERLEQSEDEAEDE